MTSRLLQLDLEGLRAANLPRIRDCRLQNLPWRIAYTVRARLLSAAGVAAAAAMPAPQSLDRPIFIIGYWRSGTTFLHELLTLSPEVGFPTSHQCFNPRTFAVSPPGRRVESRPMDAVEVTASSPQEDEFALLAMGAPSPYALWLTPGRMLDHWACGLELDAVEGDRWLRVFGDFLGRVQASCGRRLVVKSPPHSWRVQLILKHCPDARFVYIVRDPVAVFHSTRAMLRSMLDIYAIEPWRDEWVTGYVRKTRLDLFERYERGSWGDLGPGVVPVKYDSLVASPGPELRRIFAALGLSWSDEVDRRLAHYLAEHEAPARRAQVSLPPEVGGDWAGLLDWWAAGAGLHGT